MGGRIKNFSNEKPKMKLPEIGRISIGEMVATNGGKQRPRSLDYFRLYKYHDERVLKAFGKAYGEKPNKILVSFYSNDTSHVCNEKFELRCGKSSYATGDGETFHFWDPDKKQMGYQIVTSQEERDLLMADILAEATAVSRKMGIRHDPSWKHRLTMRLWLPDVQYPGEFYFSTSGKATSIENIKNSFDLIQNAAGTVVRFPFELYVFMNTSDGMDRSVYPIVELRPILGTDDINRVRELGDDLFSSINHFSKGLHVITSSDIEKASLGIEAAKDSVAIKQNPPSPEDVPEVSAEVLKKAESEDWEVEEFQENSHDSKYNHAILTDPSKMAVSEGILFLKSSTDKKELLDRYGKLIHLQKNMPIFSQMVKGLIKHSTSRAELEEIRKAYTGIVGLEWVEAEINSRINTK